jgi:4-oxalocrotonate tautomerase
LSIATLPTTSSHHPKEPTMPTIRVELFEGRTVEQKRALAQALTEATVRTLGGSADGVDVVFFDIARHDWSTGGVLWSDKGGAPAPQPPAAST